MKISFSNQAPFSVNRQHKLRDARLRQLAAAGMTSARLRAAGADAKLTAAMRRVAK